MEANPERGELAWTVGERTFVLRMRLNELCALQKRTGKSYGQLVAEVGEMNVETMRDLLFAYVQPYHSKEIKRVEQVGDLIDDYGGHISAVGMLTEFWTLNRPKKDIRPEGKATNPPMAGTGLGLSETASASASRP